MIGTTSRMNRSDLRAVERQHAVDVLDRVVLDLDAAEHPARIVDEHVDATVRRRGLLHDALHVGFDGDVAADQHGLTARPP
jgi:hypothetical protein